MMKVLGSGSFRMKDGDLWIDLDPVDEKAYDMEKTGREGSKLMMRVRHDARKCYIAIQNKYFTEKIKIADHSHFMAQFSIT